MAQWMPICATNGCADVSRKGRKRGTISRIFRAGRISAITRFTRIRPHMMALIPTTFMPASGMTTDYNLGLLLKSTQEKANSKSPCTVLAKTRKRCCNLSYCTATLSLRSASQEKQRLSKCCCIMENWCWPQLPS